MSDEFTVLNDTLTRKARDWTPEDRTRIIEGFRLVRERWNAEQQRGSKKLVRVGKPTAGKSPSAPKSITKAVEGLML